MIRFLLRFIGLWLLAAGFVFFVIDGTKSIAGNMIYLTKLSETWDALHSPSRQALQLMIEHSVLASVLNPIVTSVVSAPTWAVLGVIGSLLIVMGRKKKPLIGYARR